MINFIEHSEFFGIVISLLGYQIGMILQRKFRYAILNPLLIAIIFCITFLAITELDYDSYQKSAGILNFFLTPATIALAIVLYDKRKMLAKHLVPLMMGLLSGILIHFITVLLLSIVFDLKESIFITMIPKSITMAMGVVISDELGGFVPITIASILLTGLFGSVTCEWILNIAGIKHPIARGLAIGNAAHAMGTARAIEMGETEAASSSLALVLSGIITVLLAPMFIELTAHLLH